MVSGIRNQSVIIIVTVVTLISHQLINEVPYLSKTTSNLRASSPHNYYSNEIIEVRQHGEGTKVDITRALQCLGYESNQTTTINYPDDPFDH
jgi:hypothetical protein